MSTCRDDRRFDWQTILGWVAVLTVWGALAACGGGQTDPCSGKTCEFGVCDSSSGQCANEDSCESDDQCIPGYRCSDGSCAISNTCASDADCESGVCENNACVNPETCSANADCVDRTYCDFEEGAAGEGTCAPDPCRNTSCERGVCKPGTEQCVSKDSCTKETEQEDCISGEKCAVPAGEETGTCETSDAFCEQLTCDRGTCSFADGGCVDADDCAGDNADCLEGKFCNDMNQCRPNLCVQNDVDCGANGVCQPASGECENAESCESNENCLNDPQHLCVDGTCREEQTACGDADGDGGCPGGQICEYDGDALTAECREPEVCEMSVDCREGRRCGGRDCMQPESCSEDVFEPNDGADEATTFVRAASNRTLSASVCEGDVDVYEMETSDLLEPGESGTMLVELDVPPRDRGLGALEVRLVGPDGDEFGTATTGAQGADGHAEVTTEIRIPDYGEYAVEVSGGEDLRETGVTYDLSVDVLPSETVEACEEAETISLDQTSVDGTTQDASSSGLGSTCTSSRNGAADKVYALEVEQAREVSFDLMPDSQETNLTMSLRSRCTQIGSERACAAGAGAGQTEEMRAVLDEGTHYVVVQAPEAKPGQTEGGSFTLSILRREATCSARDDYCNGQGTANVCIDGEQFRQVDCSDGCNPATGECHPPAGNRCENAPTLSPDNAGMRQVALQEATDEYGIEASSCLGDEQAPTGGPDQAFEVTVPPKTALTADVDFPGDVGGSVYLVEDCTDASNTCRAGAQGSVDGESRETLRYANLAAESNDTNNTERLYLVVDTAADQVPTEAQLEVGFQEVVCTPGTERCTDLPGGGSEAERCSEYGTTWEVEQSCYLECRDGSCRGDSCGAPVEVPNDQSTHTYEFDPSDSFFTNQYDIDYADCGPVGDIDDSDGSEAVFQVTANAGDRIDASWEHDDPSLYIVSDCRSLAGSCGAGSESSSDEKVDASYVAPKDGKYYVVADIDESSTSYSTGTVTVQVGPATCSPHDADARCIDNSTVEPCTWEGEYGNRAACVDCNSGTCSGDDCSDAIDVPVDGTERTWTLNPQAYSANFDIDGANCMGSSYDDSAGPEAVFSIDAQADDIIESSWDHDDPSMYLVADCSSHRSSCLAGVESASDEEVSLTHKVSSAGTYYLVADVDETSTTDYRDGTVTIEASKPECDPSTYSPTCVDSRTIQECGSLGQYVEKSCPCDGGSCTGNTCSAAVDVPADDSWHEYTFNPDGAYDDQHDIDGASCMPDSSDDSPGPEAVFSVDAADGDLIEATWDHDDPSMYITSSCSGINNACVAGDESSSDEEIELAHAVSSAGTYYVFADVDEVGGTDYREGTFRAKVNSDQCDPQTATATCLDSKTREYCSQQYEVWREESCYGCSGGDCVDGSCSDPYIIGDGDSHSGEYSDGTDDLDPVGSGNTGGCSFPENTAGADWVYQVDLDANETLTADASSESSLGVFYLLGDCTDTTTCKEADGGDGQITYQAGGSPETVYVVIDHDDYSSSNPPSSTYDGYGIDITVN